MAGFYQIHEFAKLAGVTVKALHHYDRLGLLKPARTGAGYRVYCERDLERLEQIVALKFLGLPLKRMKTVLDRAAVELPAALRLQRRALEENQRLLTRAIDAIRAAENAIQPGQAADPAILKKIIQAIDMQNGINLMKKYHSEEAWERHRLHYEEGPSQEWRDLYREAHALFGEDPGSERVQALADRWLMLSVRAARGDPSVQTYSPTAWLDRDHWPPAMKRRIEEFNLEAVMEFVKQAALCSRKKYFGLAAWARWIELRRPREQVFSKSWQARVDLFRDIEAALNADPAGATAQSLARRWRAMVDRDSGGDPAVKAGLLKAWADRRNWPATLRWQTEARYMLPFPRFELAANFIERIPLLVPLS